MFAGAKVLHIAGEVVNYDIPSFVDGRGVCALFGATAATYAQMEQAYTEGAHTK